ALRIGGQVRFSPRSRVADGSRGAPAKGASPVVPNDTPWLEPEIPSLRPLHAAALQPGRERLDAIDHGLVAQGVEEVEAVMAAGKLGEAHGVARAAQQVSLEATAGFDGRERVEVPVGDEERRRLAGVVAERPERRVGPALAPVAAVPAVEPDDSGDRRVRLL